MNRRRILLVLIGLGLIFGGRYATTWRPDSIVASVLTPEDFRVVATVDRDGSSLIRRTGGGMSPEELSVTTRPVRELRLDAQRKRLFVLSESQLQCVNYLNGQEVWSVYHRLDPDQTHLLASPSKDAVVLIGRRELQYSGNEGLDVKVYDAPSGDNLHTLFRGSIEELTVRDDRMLLRRTDGQTSTYTFQQDALEQDAPDARLAPDESGLSQEVWTPDRCWELGDDGTIVREWLTDRRQSVRRIRKRPFYETSGAIIALATFILVAMVFWVRELIVDGVESTSPYRPFASLFLVTGMMFLIGAPLASRNAIEDPNPIQNRLWMLLLLATAQAALFALLLRISETRHLWIAILAACAFPPMLLVVFLARAIRSSHFGRAKQQRKFRFGIAELLLSTTGIALMIAIGFQSMWMIGLGFGIALHILISYLVTRTRELAWATVVITLVLTTLVLTLQSFTDLSALFYVFLVPFAFGVLGVHGWISGEAFSSEQNDLPALGGGSTANFWAPDKG